MTIGSFTASATAKMGEKPLLRRLVVVGGDHQQRIRASILRVQGKLDRFIGIVGASARYDRNPFRRYLDAQLDDTFVLVVGQG